MIDSRSFCPEGEKSDMQIASHKCRFVLTEQLEMVIVIGLRHSQAAMTFRQCFLSNLYIIFIYFPHRYKIIEYHRYECKGVCVCTIHCGCFGIALGGRHWQLQKSAVDQPEARPQTVALSLKINEQVHGSPWPFAPFAPFALPKRGDRVT